MLFYQKYLEVGKLICSYKCLIFEIKYTKRPKLIAVSQWAWSRNRINGSKPSMGSTFIRRIPKGVWVSQDTSRGGLFGYPRLSTQEDVVMKEPIKTVAPIVGFLLLLAILPLPYSYYTFLRLTVFVSSLFLAYQLYEKKSHGLSLVLVGLALLFNPLIPVYLSREAWLPIDLVSAGLLFYVGHHASKGAK